ncbi:MAG: hypothetical protein II085_02105, partial [Alphaproteobacteria bacterium]|nr:hypothetical protein [Alphaproteobacteria bacterium]
MGEPSLSTFVLNRKSGEPEEIFIMAYKGKDGSERYEFYRPETKYCQALIGTCILNFYPEEKIIAPSFIFSDAGDMQDVGLRCIQLAAERMNMEKYKNIVIRQDSFSNNFYDEAGFDVLKDGRLNLPKCFYDNTECTDEDFAEFIEYVLLKTKDSYNELKPQENCFLFLSGKAKKDYAKFIEKQPIITGKNLEDFFYKRQTK